MNTNSASYLCITIYQILDHSGQAVYQRYSNSFKKANLIPCAKDPGITQSFTEKEVDRNSQTFLIRHSW